MGTSFDTDAKGNMTMPDAIRSPEEYKIMQSSMESAAKELKINVAELQATLWYNEKELWRQYGHDEPTQSYTDAAKQFPANRASRKAAVGGKVTKSAATVGGGDQGTGAVPGQAPGSAGESAKARLILEQQAKGLY
jgi:hypothetical protein